MEGNRAMMLVYRPPELGQTRIVSRSPQKLVALPDGQGPIHLRLYHQIRALILDGSWPSGTHLPSSRQLADDLGISRNTAIQAVDQLVADGWVIARTGAGVFVSAEAPPARPSHPASGWGHANVSTAPAPFHVRPGPVDLFPISKWTKLQARVWNQASTEAMHESSGAGWAPLRQAVAAHLHAVRGLACVPDQVLILSSSQSAIDLALRVLAVPGDQVWVEEPGYPAARQAIRANQLTEAPVPVDAQGLCVETGIQRAAHAKIAYVTAACQYPTGRVMSEPRRGALLAWASRNDAFIVEDDWDYNACFDAPQPPMPLAARASHRVLHIHSFNRLLFPGLRIAALVVPSELAPRFIEMRQLVDGFTNVANQMALAEFIHRGALASYLRTCRIACTERRAALHRAVAAFMPGNVRIDPLQSGWWSVAHLDGLHAAPLAAQARAEGFWCMALSDFSADPLDSAQALLLGFAGFKTDALTAATMKLAQCLFPETSPQRPGR